MHGIDHSLQKIKKRGETMKSLKKAMALMVACASIFGTVANAAFLNPIDSSPTMKQLVDSSASFKGAGEYFAGYYAGPTSSTNNIVNITYDEAADAMKWDVYGFDYTWIFQNGNDYTRGYDERRSSFGKIKMTASFSFDALAKDANDKNLGSGQIINAGYIYAASAYVKDGTTTYGNAAGLNLTTKFEGQGIGWGTSKLDLYGKSVNHNFVGCAYGDKLTLTFEADCVADTASVVLYNETKDAVVGSLAVTEDDNIDILCVKDGFYSRISSIWDMTWYEFSSVREQFIAKDASVATADGKITGTIDVANNAEFNVTAIKNPSATVVMALYDSKDRMIDCGVSQSTALPIREGNANIDIDGNEKINDSDRIQNPPTYVPITAEVNATDYAYAKFFVWDGTDTMKPFTEVARVNAN